jgi:tetratricopeptide (TPR) repeat protein
VKPQLNTRLLILTLLVVLAGVGAVTAALWWRNQPEMLLKSAEEYFKKGEEAKEASDLAAARQHFESASNQLQNFFDTKINPNDREDMDRVARAMLLRYKVLDRLAFLAAGEEKDRGDTDPNRPSIQLATEARKWAFNAARNADFFEAQTVALDLCFRLEEYRLAAEYAQNVLRLADQNGDFFRLENYLHGAHYALALRALENQRPDVALEHLEASAALQKKQAGNGETPAPRWRTFAAELEARRMKVDLARQVKPRPGTRFNPKAVNPEVTRLQKEYAACLEEGQARLIREKVREIPASPTDPARPVLATLSGSDARGLFAFLGHAITDAPDREAAQQRIGLALEVCQKIVTGRPTNAALREAGKFAAMLPGTVARLSETVRPADANLASIHEAVERVTNEALKAGVPLQPITYFQMADNASRTNPTEALRLIRKGLEAADALRRPISDPVVAGLHQKAAWLLLVSGQVDEAEKHLDVLRKEKQTAALVPFLLGVAAVHDGRLEQGIRELEKARESGVSAYYRPILYATLAHAYLAIGRYPQALDSLNRVEASLKNPEKLTAEQQTMLTRMVNPEGLLLEVLRCHLGMGRMDRALEIRAKLKAREGGKEADFLVLQTLLLAGRQRVGAGKFQEAAAIYASAWPIVEEARRLYPDDPDLLRAEVDLVLNEPLAAPALPYLALGEAALAAPGMPRFARAEALVHEFAFARKELPRRIVWVQWLETTGRLAEANDVLARLEEKDFPNEKATLLVERFQLAQRMGQGPEVARLVKEIQQRGDLPTARGVFFDTLVNDFSRARGRIDAALSKSESRGQAYYLQGVLAQARGDHDQAIKGFERSLEFASFKAAAQAGLITSLAAWAARSPDDAFKEAGRLAAAHPKDPMVLLAYAQVARLTGNLYGDSGMEGALRAFTGLLARNPMSHCAAGKLWAEVGRADLARAEIRAALSLDPRHVESLLFAGQLAQDSGNWNELARLADALAYVRPNALEGMVWRGLVRENRGQLDEARKQYESVVAQAPDQATGYLRLASLKERAKDYTGALEILDRWSQRQPTDLNAFQVRTRLLALSGQDAVKMGEAFLHADRARLEKEFDEADRKVPARDDKDKAERGKARARGLAARELDGLLALVSGLRGGGALDQAEPFAARARGLIDQMGRELTGREVEQARLLLGLFYLDRGQKQKDKASIDQAIALFEAVWRESPGQPTAGNNLAWLLATERQDGAAAAAIMDRLRQARPGARPLGGNQLSPSVLDTASVVYLAAGKVEEALQLLQEALRRYRDEPRVYLNLGRCYARLKDANKAREAFNLGIDLAGRKAQTAQDDASKAHLLQLAATARDERDALERR